MPSVIWWPGVIPGATMNHIVASSLDLLPTFVSLAGGVVDPTIPLDGKDLGPYLVDNDLRLDNDLQTFVFWCGVQIFGVRIGDYKVIWRAQEWTASAIIGGALTDLDRC